MKIIILRIVGILVTVLVVLLSATRLTLGSGRDYPDLSTEPVFSSSELEVVAAMDYPLGNPAVSAEGRVFFNLHPLADPVGATVFEWVGGQAVPYPDEAFQENFNNVLGMFIDSQNWLWTLDNASLDTTATRLLAFDLSTGSVVHDHTFGDGYDFLNDLQVSPDGRTIYFSDPGLFVLQEPSLVVYDIASETPRRVLQGHPSVSTQDWKLDTPTGTMWFLRELILFQLGVDGIALGKDGEWLYYGGITHDTLYRVQTADLLNAELTGGELASRVEAVGSKPLSDGFSIDLEDNLYITDVEHQGIARMTTEGRLQTLVRDERVRWPDGISFGPGGWVYFTDSALNAVASFLPMASPDKVEANAPYQLFRFRSDVAGVPGG